MSIRKVAEDLGVTDTRLFRMLQCPIAATRTEADFSKVLYLDIDEMAIRKSHQYTNVIADLVES